MKYIRSYPSFACIFMDVEIDNKDVKFIRYISGGKWRQCEGSWPEPGKDQSQELEKLYQENSEYAKDSNS